MEDNRRVAMIEWSTPHNHIILYDIEKSVIQKVESGRYDLTNFIEIYGNSDRAYFNMNVLKDIILGKIPNIELRKIELHLDDGIITFDLHNTDNKKPNIMLYIDMYDLLDEGEFISFLETETNITEVFIKDIDKLKDDLVEKRKEIERLEECISYREELMADILRGFARTGESYKLLNELNNKK